MADKLEVTGVYGIAKPEPGIVEITLEQAGQTTSVLRMSLLTFLNLWSGIKHLASPAEPLVDEVQEEDAEEPA